MIFPKKFLINLAKIQIQKITFFPRLTLIPAKKTPWTNHTKMTFQQVSTTIRIVLIRAAACSMQPDPTTGINSVFSVPPCGSIIRNKPSSILHDTTKSIEQKKISLSASHTLRTFSHQYYEDSVMETKVKHNQCFPLLIQLFHWRKCFSEPILLVILHWRKMLSLSHRRTLKRF